jgi:Zn-dependent peptidase ImmA (M78 family)
MYKSLQPISRDKLRLIAKTFKSRLGFDGIFTDVPRLLEVIQNEYPELDVEIVENHELPPKVFAEFIPSYSRVSNKPLIKIKEYVYDNACNPLSRAYGRDRMNIVHEIAHFILIDIFKIEVLEHHESGISNLANSVEWQAMALAGEIMIPFEETIGIENEIELAKKCGVSKIAANYRIKKYNKE